MIQNNSADPFDAASIPIDPSVHDLLQYFILVSHPRTWSREVKVEHSYLFRKSAYDIVASCIGSAMGMLTMLASMASQMEYFESSKQPYSPTLLMQKAIAATRRQISLGEVDVNLMFGIHSLANAEFYRFDVKAARVHLEAEKNLIMQKGGLTALPNYFQEWILSGDEFIAAESYSKPLWPVDKIGTGPWSEAPEVPGLAIDSTVTGWDSLPSELQAMALGSRRVVQVLSGQTSTLEEYNHARMPPGRWLHLKAWQLRNQSLTLTFADAASEAMRLALLAFSYLILTVTGRRRTMKVVASQLRSVLSAAEELAHSDLKSWILIAGALASSEQDRYWFETQLIVDFDLMVGFKDAVLTETDVLDVLRPFLYYEPEQLPRVQELVFNINDRLTKKRS